MVNFFFSAREKEMVGEEEQWREIGVESEQLSLLKQKNL